MSKVAGSYESVVRGVSEQSPQDRRSGQHHNQENMISDPVRGLARRHGSILQHEVIVGDTTVENFDGLTAITEKSRPFTFKVDGIEYDLIYRTGEAGSYGQTAFAFAFNRDSEQFIPIVYAEDDDTLDDLTEGGVSAIVNIGKFIFLAGNTITPTWTGTDRHSTAGNIQRIAGWVRGGAYSRTFKITLKRADGTELEASYKTVSASYPELLDTSDLLTADPDYQKLVNDRVYAYNSEVTKWIGTAAEDITPENIAQELVDALILAGVDGVSRVDGTVFVEDAEFVEASGEDGGDGSLFRVVGNELLSADLLSTLHWVGKIVKVKPQRSNGDDAFYLEAFAKDNVSTGITEVSWREAAGFRMQPDKVLILGTVAGGTLYLASDPAALAVMASTEVPTFQPNAVGDDITSPLPTMFGNRIDYLGQMQDRLIIGSGVVLLMSKPGKYFDWFRTSVLTVTEDDPIEIFSLGSEDDTIRSSANYDRNLLLFGYKKQYTINGRQPLTPKTASVVAVTAYEDAIDAEPRTSGNFVFYAQRQGQGVERKTSMHQIQVGQLADTPESKDIGQQLSEYLQGTPVQIMAITTPNLVVLRTTASRTSLYTYTYMDNAGSGERLFDSWSKWSWDAALGNVIGITKSRDGSGLFVYLLRQGLNAAGVRKWWVACEQFSLQSTLSKYPYADSIRSLASLTGSDSFINPNNIPASGCVAFGQGSQRPFVGALLSARMDFIAAYEDSAEAWIGVFPATYVTPTNPFMRDRNGNNIVTGRLTLSKVAISVNDTAALTMDVTSVGGTKNAITFTGRLLGQAANLIGYQPVVNTSLVGPVGKETRKCTYTLTARTWLPMTITAIEWVGQYFSNVKRVS